MSKFYSGIILSFIFLIFSCTSFSKDKNEKEKSDGIKNTQNKTIDLNEKSDETGDYSIPAHQVKDGTLVVFSMLEKNGNEITSRKIKFEGENFPVLEGSEKNKRFALIPVPFNSKPRETKITIETLLKNGKKIETILSFSVIDGEYRHETLKVQNSKINPSKKNAKRIMDEQKEVGALYKIERPKRFWSGKFSAPLSSEITSPFGNKRIYNGQMKSFHQGMDFRAKIGTEIKAPESGEVVLSKDLYLTGWTVILDHGYGFFTVYCHMSKLGVKVGDIVKKSDVLGLSGDTGRVSGPHLHWGAVISRSKINPENLLTLLPDVL